MKTRQATRARVAFMSEKAHLINFTTKRPLMSPEAERMLRDADDDIPVRSRPNEGPAEKVARQFLTRTGFIDAKEGTITRKGELAVKAGGWPPAAKPARKQHDARAELGRRLNRERTPGAAAPDKPGAAAPDKPGATAPDKPGAAAPGEEP